MSPPVPFVVPICTPQGVSDPVLPSLAAYIPVRHAVAFRVMLVYYSRESTDRMRAKSRGMSHRVGKDACAL